MILLDLLSFLMRRKMLFLLLLPVISVVVAHHAVTGFTIYNDGIGYYSYLRSIAIDGDVGFQNEWDYYKGSFSKFSTDVPRGVNFPETKTSKGLIENIYLIGNAVMWLPFFLAVHIPTLLIGGNADGYGLQYEAAIGAANVFYGFAGIILIFLICRKFYDEKTSTLATVAVWYGTSALWFHAVEPSMSHMNSLFLASAFTLFWLNTVGRRTLPQWFILGLLLGLVYLVRQQDAIIGLLPAFEFTVRLKYTPLRWLDAPTFKAGWKKAAVLASGTLTALTPQFFVWREMYGRWLVYSYSQISSYWSWGFPQVASLLFRFDAGMIRMPAMLVGLVGIFILAFTVRGVFIPFAAVTAAQVLITSSWSGWYVGYGLRFLLGLAPFFALGLCSFFARLEGKTAYAALGIFVLANFASMTEFLVTEVTS